MASTPSQDNNDVSFDDYKTSNARFQSRLRAMRQPSEASHSSRSSEPSARPVSDQEYKESSLHVLVFG